MALYQLLRVGVLKTDTGQRLIPQSGQLWDAYLAWRKSGNVPDPYVPDPPPVESLPEAKQRRRQAIRREGVERIQTRFPAISNFDTLALVREIMLSVAPAARALTTDMQWADNTYSAGSQAITQVNAATTVAEVDAVTVSWPAL